MGTGLGKRAIPSPKPSRLRRTGHLFLFQAEETKEILEKGKGAAHRNSRGLEWGRGAKKP